MKTCAYTESLTHYQRRKTVDVYVGNVPMGGNFPVRLQSMVNTGTCQIAESIKQCIRLIKAGAHYIRFTVPSFRDVACLKQVRQKLLETGYDIPLIADVHFNAAITTEAADVVEKVRINPGNYGKAGKHTGGSGSTSNGDEALKHTGLIFRQLLKHCRNNNVALRIGVNHGSLSSRIIMQYGDTPEGMAESAMELLRICKDENFDQVVVSMKSSNVLVMVQATRLIVSKMNAEGMHYPLHLGVTEAGEGDDGRIKSAAGIGALLADGIGDTIRVSLTEDPVAEIPVAKKLVSHFEDIKSHEKLPELHHFFVDPFEQHKRETKAAANIGGKHVPVVIAETGRDDMLTENQLAEFGWYYNPENDSWTFAEQSVDYVFTRSSAVNSQIPLPKGIIMPSDEWKSRKSGNIFPLYNTEQYLQDEEISDDLHFIAAGQKDINDPFIRKMKSDRNAVLIYSCSNKNATAEFRIVFARLHDLDCQIPVVVRNTYHEADLENFQVKSASDFGATFIDGLGNGIWLSNTGNAGTAALISTAFGILQACRLRISRTEYIACPSCGRTHFNIMKTLAEIKKKTSHLKGLKIGVMGCIVNGPGEMADADYGYVGSGKGRITLYKAKQVVKRNILEENAVEELVNLIKENGDWVNRE